MRKVYLPAEDVWEYAADHIDDLCEEPHEIASEEDFGVSVYMTADVDHDYDLSIVVAIDEEEVFCEKPYTPSECEDIVIYAYEKYIYTWDFLEDDVEYLDEVDEEYENDVDRDRELELFDACEEFLNVACECDNRFYDDDISEILDKFLGILEDDYQVEIYRPRPAEHGEHIDDFPYDEDFEYDDDYDDYEWVWRDADWED